MTPSRGASTAPAPAQMLLLVESPSNRRLLEQVLRPHYRTVMPTESSLQRVDFDLIVADPRGLARHQARVREARDAQLPTLLPLLLLITRGEMRVPLARFRDLVDEFAVLPVDRLELTTRLHLWMRARRLALKQRDDLAYLVNHDRLTGLPTRSLLSEYLHQALTIAAGEEQQVCLQMIEVSGKALLMALSPAGRDRAVVELTNRLTSLLDAQAHLARLGETRWGLLHPPGAPVEQVLELARSIRRRLAAPLDIDGERLYLTPRMGIAVAPDDAGDAEGLIDRARQALTDAGDGPPAFFSPDMQQRVREFLRVEAMLRQALVAGGLELWLQPKVSLDGRRDCRAAEALIRLRCADGRCCRPTSSSAWPRARD